MKKCACGEKIMSQSSFNELINMGKIIGIKAIDILVEDGERTRTVRLSDFADQDFTISGEQDLSDEKRPLKCRLTVNIDCDGFIARIL